MTGKASPSARPPAGPARPEPGWRTKVLVSAVMLIFLAAFVETAARLLPAGRDELSQITGILRPDSGLFWTQKPGLDTNFAGVPLRTNSLGFRGTEPETPKGRFRIAVMGASPAMGWGVREELTYAELLQRRLEEKGRTAEVVNASVIGYSSFQGLKLFRRSVLPLKPDLLIIAYGVNDPDKYRFFRDSDLSDKDVPPEPTFVSALNRAAQASHAVTIYARLLHRLAGKPSEGGASFRENRRVSGTDLTANLRQITTEAREAGIKVILVTNPFMLPPGLDRGVSPRDLFRQAAAAKGKERAALLKAARISEMADCMTVLENYNRIIRDLAAGLGAPLCDLQAVFSPGGKPEPAFFLEPGKDMVHFSPAGHQAAAAALAKTVEKMIN